MTIEDFRERRALRGRESVDYCQHDVPRWQPCELCAVDRVTSKYYDWARHTIDLKRGTQSVDPDGAQFQSGWIRAKYAWMFMLGLIAGYVLGRFVAPWVWGG